MTLLCKVGSLIQIKLRFSCKQPYLKYKINLIKISLSELSSFVHDTSLACPKVIFYCLLPVKAFGHVLLLHYLNATLIRTCGPEAPGGPLIPGSPGSPGVPLRKRKKNIKLNSNVSPVKKLL